MHLNHLPQMHTLASMRSTLFIEIGDKGGEIGQRYEICKKKHWGEVGKLGIGHGHGPRGSNIEELRRIKKIEELRRIKISWTREAHK